MSQIPAINVQLIHIQGPLKGEIQDFSRDQILIGRHPDCDLQFPKDLVVISRRHAMIIREGNRFKLVDQSTNGTYVNGKQISEVYLKDGDVITFAEGGPKVSFLTQVTQATPGPVQGKEISAPQAGPPPGPAPATPPPSPTTPPDQATGPTAGAVIAPGSSDPQAEQVSVPFAIQYGPTLKSFKSLPLIIGKDPGCDFVIEHPALELRHVQVFFSGESYWIKDLTGRGRVLINGQPLEGQAPLKPEVNIRLGADGPVFKFLGGGRLVEEEKPAVQTQSGQLPPQGPGFERQQPDAKTTQGERKKTSSLFKKFFS